MHVRIHKILSKFESIPPYLVSVVRSPNINLLYIVELCVVGCSTSHVRMCVRKDANFGSVLRDYTF